MVINPGSKNKGGTLNQAREIAEDWLDCIHKEGFTDVEMDQGEIQEDGNFLFKFTHKVTGKVVEFRTHGFTDEECKEFIFHPRVYWNGSSTANPKIEDWLTDEYSFKVTYFKN